MPHRPNNQVSSPHHGNAGGIDASLYTPPRVPGTAAAAIMRQTNATHAVAAAMYGAARSAGSGVVTPLLGSNKHWLASASIDAATGNALAGAFHGSIHHGAIVPSLESRNKSTDSTDRSTGNTSHDDSRSVATLATEDDREATASALLMVAKAAEREHLNGMMQHPAAHAELASASSGGSASTIPHKKRKKHMDLLRRQAGEDAHDEDEADAEDDSTAVDKKDITTTAATTTSAEQDPCHISPVSHSSAEHGLVDGRTESAEDSTPTRRIIPPTGANRTNSYDSKDLLPSFRRDSKPNTTKELLDSAKVHSTAQIGAPPTLPSQVLIPHFPTVLHQVLADKEFDGKVVQWLPDGEAWKVLRWDALRRQVLPRYFADLRDENGGGCGTIDAFLFHLGAWGFEEIKDGTDVGAYRHDLFIRGAQKLCVKMRFAADESKGPNTVSPHRSYPGEAERSMLQVPSLADSQMSLPPHKRPRYEGQPSSQGAMNWPYSESRSIWGGQFPSDGPHYMYGIRSATTSSFAAGGQYNPGSSLGGDPRLQLRRSSTPDNLARQGITPGQQYSPSQVRSGRGAIRLASGGNRSSATSSPSTAPVVRQGISVSNRGKGPRKPAVCRPALASSTEAAEVVIARNQEGSTSPSTTPSENSQKAVSAALSEAHRIGSAVQGVAIAISRKTKRKLPMAGKKLEDEPSNMSVIKLPESGNPETTKIEIARPMKEDEANVTAANEAEESR